jgi:tetratricopeptide (TPR) repeat protein
MVQQTSRRRVGGERLGVKVGINAGEAMSEGDPDGRSDYFGTPVVVARRLCDRAEPGQIICSAVIEALLAGRQAFAFHDLGPLALKGIAAPVEAREVAYETDRAGVLLTRTPFVGRGKEMARLRAKLDEARAGHGGLVMLVGEPGIGKSRTIEEFAEQARSGGAFVLAGRCFEGEWAPPYAPFAEAMAGYAKDADPDVLGADLGYGAAPVARLVPSLRERLPEIGEPVPLNPDEERFRLLDAVSQFIIATSARAPVVLVLDDLHWADGGTIAMLRHVARFLPGQRTLLLGAYRDVELDRRHPLADALAALRSEAEYERILVKGLDEGEVRALLTDIAEQDVPDAFVQAISAETDGNPFFIREVLNHLAEEGKIYQQDGRWASDVSIAEMGIPEGVRQVIGRRLSRLSDNANRLLTAASGFNGPFRVGLAAAAAGLDEGDALDAIDAALEAQLVQPAGDAESYDFAHALIRHTLYAELSPSRQVRLHRQIAEAMERLYGDRAMEHAAELAYQYHRSAGLLGADRGADYAVAAADQAERLPAWDEVAVFSRMALDLLHEADARRPRVAGRLGLALAWSTGSDEAARACAEAADTLAKAEGDDAAADYLAGATGALWNTNGRAAWDLATQGMAIIGTRRDATWATLAWSDAFRRDAEDPDDVGIPLLTEERRQIIRVLEQSPDNFVAFAARFFFQSARTRDEALAQAAEVRPGRTDDVRRAQLLMNWAGDYRSAKEVFRQSAERYEREGDIGFALSAWANVALGCYALGELAEGDAALARCEALAPRLAATSVVSALAARAAGGLVRGEFESLLAEFGTRATQPRPEQRWVAGPLRAAGAAAMAFAGHGDAAISVLATAIPALERAEGSFANYTVMACCAADTLFVAERTDYVEVIERNLREKVVEPDFRQVGFDGRLSLARLCAVSGRFEEAGDWFARARAVLEEQGARPLRAIVDYDEALMYVRRAAEGDRERALPLLDAALTQFRDIGMTGWLRRGEELRDRLLPL